MMNMFSSIRRCGSLIGLFCWLLASPFAVSGQEIDAQITVDRSQINTTSLSYLDNFSDELETYINEYNWIDASFRPEERLKVNIQITLLSTDDNFNFNAQVVFRSRRPIYGTIRETALFFYNEESWNFTYTPNRTLIHDELQFDTLTSFLDFYCYLLIGYDFDSFSPLGGTPYFLEAQNVVSRAQSSANGWNRGGLNQSGRAQLIANLLNPGYKNIRQASYQYHRQGLDQFVSDPEAARQQIIGALQKIQKAKQTTSSNLLFDIFFNTKYRELSAIFEDAAPEVQQKAFDILAEIDPSHLSEYRKLQ